MFFYKISEVLYLVLDFIYKLIDISLLILNDIQNKISQMEWINIIGFCLIIIISILIGGKVMKKVLSLIINLFKKFTLETALLFSIIGYYMTSTGFKYIHPDVNLIVGCTLQIISIVWLCIMGTKISIMIKRKLSNNKKVKDKSKVLDEENSKEIVVEER